MIDIQHCQKNYVQFKLDSTENELDTWVNQNCVIFTIFGTLENMVIAVIVTGSVEGVSRQKFYENIKSF